MLFDWSPGELKRMAGMVRALTMRAELSRSIPLQLLIVHRGPVEMLTPAVNKPPESLRLSKREPIFRGRAQAGLWQMKCLSPLAGRTSAQIQVPRIKTKSIQAQQKEQLCGSSNLHYAGLTPSS